MYSRFSMKEKTKEGEEVGAHLVLTSAFFPVFEEHLSGNDVVHFGLPKFSFKLCFVKYCRIEKTNVSEVWSSANATKNEVLIWVRAPLVVMNWEMWRTSRLF
ncbi:unnamed protein product [Hymenolepis diminuta]|uniref:DUF663 domain-containing protein n=1 Tax=Hymenolepis diminuta TaxID=6216 RepID=A0A0R3SXB6_HYMDI|nr:unnamed protein product [Hymenolepis diminuta]